MDIEQIPYIMSVRESPGRSLLEERNVNMAQFRQSFGGKLLLFSLAFFAVVGLFYWVVAEDWTMSAVETDTVSQSILLPAGSVAQQEFDSIVDGLEWLSVTPHFETSHPAGTATFTICDDQGVQLWQKSVDVSELESDRENVIRIEPYLPDMQDRTLVLRVEPGETGMALWAGTSVSAGKFDINVKTEGLMVNGEALAANLVMKTGGHLLLSGAKYIWPVAAVLWAAMMGLCVITRRDINSKKNTLLTKVVRVYEQYRYLIKQLVVRDFRVKYKSSSLGVAWSVLNPLLTMVVYLFVFSTLFQSNVEYFPVYLLSGIVLFNSFSESTNLGLNSIVGNSALITKVYMPKMIYPLSKVLSSFINLCISFVPLLLVMLIVGIPFKKSLLLLPVVIVLLFMLCLGMSLLLATMNVFFRDTQFLWGVMVMLLNFLSPIFYPESIIPAQFLFIYRLNPIYQLLFFIRSIIINGVSPTPASYLYCILTSAVPLLIGIWIFRRNQDRFVLYL